MTEKMLSNVIINTHNNDIYVSASERWVSTIPQNNHNIYHWKYRHRFETGKHTAVLNQLMGCHSRELLKEL